MNTIILLIIIIKTTTSNVNVAITQLCYSGHLPIYRDNKTDMHLPQVSIIKKPYIICEFYYFLKRNVPLAPFRPIDFHINKTKQKPTLNFQPISQKHYCLYQQRKFFYSFYIVVIVLYLSYQILLIFICSFFFSHGLVFIVHWLQSSLERLKGRYTDSTLEKSINTSTKHKTVKMT